MRKTGKLVLHMNNKFDDYIENLQTELMIWPAYYTEQDKNYNQSLPDDKNATILEFGPGRGYFTDWLICKGYQNITLVELDKGNCDFLKSKYKNFPNIGIIYGDMASYLVSTDRKYNYIISKQVIEHVDITDIHNVFNEGTCALEKGGCMIHETINASNLVYGTYYRYIDFSHTTSFTEKSLQEFCGTKLEFRNYYHSSIYTLIREKFFRTASQKIGTIKQELNLKPQEIEIEGEENNSSKKLSIFSAFLSHFISNLRWSLSSLISKLFFGSRVKVTTPFIIVVLRK
jgi:2-polyprenyl-3-methyl-5-hydroxy-6-metoxy-1,4-benzoquinol methylase